MNKTYTKYNKVSLILKQLLAFCLLGFMFTLPAHAQSLEDYLQTASKNNPGMQSQYKEFEAAMEKVSQANSLPDPNFSFGYFISPVETRVGPQRAKLSLSQMFPWFGTLKAQGDATSLMAEAKYQNFLDAQNNLYFQVAQAYYPLVELDQLKRIEAENIDILQSYKNIATKNFENGLGSMVDVLRVDLQLQESQTSLEILERKETSLKSRFNTLLNRENNESIILPDSLQVDFLLEKQQNDSLFENHPRIKELELKTQAYIANEKAASKQGMPKFGVGVDYVIVGENDNSTMEDNGKDAIMPMVSMSIPIYRKKYKSAQREAQLMQEAMEFQSRELQNTLSSNYYRQDFQLQQSAEMLALYDEQIKSLEQILRLLYSAYSNSGKNFEEVLRIQQQLLKYEKMKINTEIQYLIAVAEMDYITAKAR